MLEQKEKGGGERKGRKQEVRKNGSWKGRGGEGGRVNLMSGRRVKVKRIVSLNAWVEETEELSGGT